MRHNEDLINAELAKNLPLDTEGLMQDMPMWDPHVKAFLLLQAHMARVDLPISDYVGDQISVLDQSIRIIQAGIDLTAELDRGDAVVLMMRLLQSVKSARFDTDYSLSMLPGVSEVWDERLKGKVPEDLVQAAQLASRHGKQVVDGLLNVFGIAGGEKGQFVKAINALPDLDLKAGAEVGQVNVTLKRRNRLHDRGGRIFAPRFPKPQNEGYFVVITPTAGGARQAGSVLALKRANWPNLDRGGNLISNVRIKLEESEVERLVDVLLLSDSYPGMEWRMEGVKVPKNEIQSVTVDVDESLVKGKKGDSV